MRVVFMEGEMGNKSKKQETMLCPDCKGRGENRDAMQAWDIPGAPIPECKRCRGRGTIKRRVVKRR